MPRRHSVSTEHRNEDGEQVTEMTVEFDDGDTVTFEVPPGGPYEFVGGDESPDERTVNGRRGGDGNGVIVSERANEEWNEP